MTFPPRNPSEGLRPATSDLGSPSGGPSAVRVRGEGAWAAHFVTCAPSVHPSSWPCTDRRGRVRADGSPPAPPRRALGSDGRGGGRGVCWGPRPPPPRGLAATRWWAAREQDGVRGRGRRRRAFRAEFPALFKAAGPLRPGDPGSGPRGGRGHGLGLGASWVSERAGRGGAGGRGRRKRRRWDPGSGVTDTGNGFGGGAPSRAAAE